MAPQIVDRTTYIPRDSREGYGRDCTHRPARWDDAVSEVWEVIDDYIPTATAYRAANLPGIIILNWRAGEIPGALTVVRNVDGIRASIDSTTWWDAVSAAYGYAGWDNPRYAA